MTMLVFNSQRAGQVAPLVEERLRKEMGCVEPLPYGVHFRGAQVCTLRFQLPGPRPARLRVCVDRQGHGSYVGALLYCAQLAKALTGPVALDGPDGGNAGRFQGQATLSARLNADADLLAQVCRLARAEADMGSFKIVGRRLCRLLPLAGGALLVLGTVPRSTALGFAHWLDVREFLDLAARLEAAL